MSAACAVCTVAISANADSTEPNQPGNLIRNAIRHYDCAMRPLILQSVTKCSRSHIDFDVVGAQFHQLAPRRGLALAHELGDLTLRTLRVEAAQADLQQAACVGVERGFPQLLCAHFAQALEAADAPSAFAHAVLAQL